MKSRYIIIGLIVGVVTVVAIYMFTNGVSSDDYQTIPKPRGYMRNDLPISNYTKVKNMPICFEINEIANDTLPVVIGEGDNGTKWLDIVYPQFNATIHCSYIKVNAKTLYYHLDNRIDRVMMNANFQKPKLIDLVSVEDDKIKSTIFINKYGGLTPIEFIATDSVSFMLSGTLAIYGEVNVDSISPIIDYLECDIEHLLKTICH